jgi:universal stress protein F
MSKKILVPVNLQNTALAEKAIGLAVNEAQTSGASLIVMTVAPGFGMPIVASFFPEDAVHEALKEIARQLKAYIAENIPSEIDATAVVTEGNPAEQIINHAREAKVDLIIMPSNDSALEQVLLGSVSARVARHAHCSVMVVKGD